MTPIRLTLSAMLLSLAGCASLGAANDPTAGLDNPQVKSYTEANGDRIDEYRVAGQLRVVKVTPARGVTYYLMDRNGDGRPDTANTNDNAPVTYYKLFGW